MMMLFRAVTIHRCIVRSYSRLSDTGVSNHVLKNRDSEGPTRNQLKTKYTIYLLHLTKQLQSLLMLMKLKRSKLSMFTL